MMKLILCVFAVFIVGTRAAVPSPRIVGGKNARPGQFPHQVSIIYNEKHHCGGSIITDRWILTAAHCVAEVPVDELFILVGTTKLNQGGNLYNVAEGRVHSEWNPMTIQHDIAVLKTDQAIVLDSLVQIIPLNSENIAPGTILQLSGWGYTAYPNIEEPNDLQYLNVHAISLDECKQTEELIFDTQICTLSPPGEGSCRGDSGGPLIYRQTLVGIVSWGRLCALGRPDVYTNVAQYAEWIFDAISD